MLLDNNLDFLYVNTFVGAFFFPVLWTKHAWLVWHKHAEGVEGEISKGAKDGGEA